MRLENGAACFSLLPEWEDKQLPSVPSELLELALQDAQWAAGQGYELDMSIWYERSRSTCSVCLAGAVLARRIRVEEELVGEDGVMLVPNSCDRETRERLKAIDEMRTGALHFLSHHYPIWHTQSGDSLRLNQIEANRLANDCQAEVIRAVGSSEYWATRWPEVVPLVIRYLQARGW